MRCFYSSVVSFFLRLRREYTEKVRQKKKTEERNKDIQKDLLFLKFFFVLFLIDIYVQKERI